MNLDRGREVETDENETLIFNKPAGRSCRCRLGTCQAQYDIYNLDNPSALDQYERQNLDNPESRLSNCLHISEAREYIAEKKAAAKELGNNK